MGLMAAVAAGATVGLGLALLVAGLLKATPASTASSTGLWTRVRRQWTALSPARRGWVLAAFGGGAVAALVTGWPLLLVLVPLLLITVPALLAAPAQPEIEVLAGLDRWVRLVSTSLTAGKSIRDAIFATRAQAPAVLRGPVDRLCARLDQRWTARDALFAMADELKSADADAVLAALSIAAARGGGGTRATLAALTDSIQARLRGLREIAAERAKPRAVARQVTMITAAVLTLMVFLNPSFFVPYATPIGSVVAGILVSAYLGCLVILRRKMVPPPAPRFLRGPS
ncbi:MAG: type II secretion system F family protein [Arachnia sp.]